MDPSCLTALAHAVIQDFMVALILNMKCVCHTVYALMPCNANKPPATFLLRFNTATYEAQFVLLQKHNVLIIENKDNIFLLLFLCM